MTFEIFTLFSALPGIDTEWIINTLGLFGIAAIIFAESGLLIGFFLPGDSLLFTAGFLVHTGIFKVDIHMLVLVLFLAAVLGDTVGYSFGRRVGRKLFKKPDSFLFRKENIDHAEKFYEKHGVKTIIIARFVPFVRTFAPIVAGIGKMKYRTFISFNVIGALLWAVGITYLGYFAGGLLEKMGIGIDAIILPVVAVILIISIAPAAYHLLKEPESRKKAKIGIKKAHDHFKQKISRKK